ncbi:MAG: R3H domain protein [Pelotomaculum sp. PtaU1.Bin035]|nr:MAG: R3H domain protein [Pelotomaculum sp. PtaU1.Bin035]
MKVIERTGRTVGEAIDMALQDMRASRDDVEVEVIEEPSKGILGFFGAKPARVKVILKEKMSKRAADFLNNIFNSMDLQVDMDVVEKEEVIFINLDGRELGILIGRRGETLDAIQFLVNLSVNKNQEVRKKIIIDVEGYRNRREETLQKLAFKLANKARQRGRSVVLEPMSSQERRIIHNALQERDDIYTFSEGDEPYRKIIITPKK